jgi:hypothetical protein
MHNTKSFGFKAILGAVITAAASTSAIAAAPSFADCFKLKPGVAYTLSDRSKVQIVKSQFAGKAAVGVVSTDGGVKTARFFDETGRQRLGSEQYGVAALGGNASKVVIKEVFTAPFPEGPHFPLFLGGIRSWARRAGRPWDDSHSRHADPRRRHRPRNR